MTFHDVIILLKSVFNKDKTEYYYNILLEKASYELPFDKIRYLIRGKSGITHIISHN